MATFSIIMTATGLAKQAAWEAGGDEITITHLAVGDSNGAYYDPDETQTALMHEVWRGTVARVFVHPDNANRVVIEAGIEAADGGFDIREVGIFDADNDLIMVGKYPLTTKPASGSGVEKELTIQVVKELANTALMTIFIDSLAFVTQAQLDSYVTYPEFNSHVDDTDDPHAAAGYVKQSELQSLLEVEAVPQALDVETLPTAVLAGTQIDVGFDYIANGLFLEVYRNGLRQVAGADEDYQEVVANPIDESRFVTFNYDLAAGEKILFAVSGLVNMDGVYASRSDFNRVKRYFFSQL